MRVPSYLNPLSITYQSVSGTRVMASWSMLPCEIRHHILSYFSRIIMEDTRYLNKHPYQWAHKARGYGRKYYPFYSYMNARRVNRDFLYLLNDIQVDGKSPHEWLKKEEFKFWVKRFTRTAGWENFVKARLEYVGSLRKTLE